MNIFTSNFATAKGLDDSKFMVVCISRFAPRGYKGVRCSVFAPSLYLLRQYKAGLSQVEYEKCYRFEINCLGNIRKPFEGLALLAKGRDIVLCCYENRDAFCHRHILSDIVFEKFGYRIKEL